MGRQPPVDHPPATLVGADKRDGASSTMPLRKGLHGGPRCPSSVMLRPSLLARLGLDRPELRAWAMYDWAASAMQTTVMVAVFPIYFVKVAGAGLPEGAATQRLATVNSLALVVIALVSPVLGAISDYGGTKKRFLAGFM